MMAKLFLILGLLTAALLGCLWVAGVISADLFSDTLGRILGMLAILGTTSGLIGLVLQRKKELPPSSTINSGPKF